MKLDKIQFIAMDNQIRAFIQSSFEVKFLRKISKLEKSTTVLEIGCGNGYGTELIKKHFDPKEIYAIDVDEKMIALAKRKHTSVNCHFEIGDAAKLRFPDNYFDAVSDFGVIHHIPNWQDCIKKILRVLKPNGEFLIEDFSIDSFDAPIGKILRKITSHPYDQMYNTNAFFKDLESCGFTVTDKTIYNPGGLIPFFTACAVKN